MMKVFSVLFSQCVMCNQMSMRAERIQSTNTQSSDSQNEVRCDFRASPSSCLLFVLPQSAGLLIGYRSVPCDSSSSESVLSFPTQQGF